MAKDHGPSIKNDEQYEALREEGMRGRDEQGESSSHSQQVSFGGWQSGSDGGGL